MAKEKGVRLHKKYGLNPTMPVCMYCEREKGEIAMLGAAYDGEAPMRMVIDIQPCDDCRKEAIEANSVFITEVAAEPKKGVHPRPNGQWARLSLNAFEAVFGALAAKHGLPAPGSVLSCEIGVVDKLKAMRSEAESDTAACTGKEA